WRRERRRAGEVATFKNLDDDHGAAAARASWTNLRLLDRVVGRWGRDAEQASSAFEVSLAPGAGEEPIVADPMKSARQSVEEEAADELVSRECHDLLPSGAGLTVVLIAERDARLVEANEAAVRYGDAVGVARQIGEHRLGPGERRLGIN